MAIIDDGRKAAFVYAGVGNNEIFDPAHRCDGLKDKWIALKQHFFQQGIDLVTADLVRGQPLFEIHLNVQRSSHKGKVPAFAVLVETPEVYPANGDLMVLGSYRKIFTWDPSRVDGEQWLGFSIGHPMELPEADGFAQRRIFCSMIAVNKTLAAPSGHGDLYLERQKLIRWFERYAPEDFMLFGGGWDAPPRRPGLANNFFHRAFRLLPASLKGQPFPSWQGRVPSKQEILQQTRFNIAYENVAGYDGYITEKIFDAFSAGCVPVYWGAENISDCIPESCFVDRRRFKNDCALYAYLKAMPEEEYIGYQESIRNFIISDAAMRFSPDAFAENIVRNVVSDLDVLSRAV